MTVQISITDQNVLLTIDSKTALTLIQTLAVQMATGNPDKSRVVFKTTNSCEDGVSDGYMLTISVLDNVKEARLNTKESSAAETNTPT